MKIKKLEITNVKSFYCDGLEEDGKPKPVTVNFNEGLNIFIGPNGGGKTNFLGILRTLLNSKDMINHYIDMGDGKIERITPVDLNPEPFRGKETEEQKIEIEFDFTESDEKNLQIIKTNLNRIKLLLSKKVTDNKIENGLSILLNTFFQQLDSLKRKSYTCIFLKKIPNTFSLQGDGKRDEESDNYPFRLYIQSVNIIEILLRELMSSEEDQTPILNLPVLFCSADRDPQFPKLVSLANSQQQSSNEKNLLRERIENQRKNIILNRIANKYRKNGDNRDFLEVLQDDPQVKSINTHLERVNLNFYLQRIDYRDNTYQLLINKKGGKPLNLNQLSSGEESIVYFLFHLGFYIVNGGMVIIDEPELHLHPQWQSKLLTMFSELSQKSGIQIFIVTHSTSFVSENTISDTFRVFHDKKADSSRILKSPSKLNQNLMYRFIHATNNEKLFFSDFILICEGICDKYVFSEFNLTYMISEDRIGEIIESDGIGDRKKIMKFLDF